MKISKGHGASELFLVHRQDTHLSCQLFGSVQSSREEYPTSLYFGYTFQRLARLKMRLIAFFDFSQIWTPCNNVCRTKAPRHATVRVAQAQLAMHTGGLVVRLPL